MINLVFIVVARAANGRTCFFGLDWTADPPQQPREPTVAAAFANNPTGEPATVTTAQGLQARDPPTPPRPPRPGPGQAATEDQTAPWRACSQCGCYEPFQHITAECCLASYGVPCTFGDSDMPAPPAAPGGWGGLGGEALGLHLLDDLKQEVLQLGAALQLSQVPRVRPLGLLLLRLRRFVHEAF